ncbi:MAG: PEP-CTERM sorting domain-containing protein [Colwellia sp.]
MKWIQIVAVSIILIIFSNVTFAGAVVSCDDDRLNGKNLDYGNATDQESSACHATNAWQQLGSDWDSDSPSTEETDLTTNDGVSWVTSNDGGANWVTNGELTSGGLVKFQFNVARATTGNHKYDLLESWIDWNQDGEWNDDEYDNTNADKERIISEKWWKNQDSEGNVATSGNKNWDLSTWNELGQADNGSKNRDGNWFQDWYGGNNQWAKEIYNSDDQHATYTTGKITIPVLDALQEIWLRVRVVCENSLERYSDGMNLIATGYQHQGEVEDYKLTVASNSGAQSVPEPSTLFIFALGLLAFVIQRKQA